jgi:hypothetical protein
MPPIVAAAGEQPDARALAADHQAVAVVLDLVNPIPTLRRMARPDRDAGRNEGQRKGAAAGIRNHFFVLRAPSPRVESYSLSLSQELSPIR